MNFELSESQRIDILVFRGYGDKTRSYREVCELFNARYPDRRIKKSTVCRTLQRYEQTRSIKNVSRSGRPKTATSDENKLNVLLQLEENPRTSLAQQSLNLNQEISKASVNRILKQEKIKPYKIIYTQELLEDDPDRRMEFCEVMMERIHANPIFSRNILFSDESTFCLMGRLIVRIAGFGAKTTHIG